MSYTSTKGYQATITNARGKPLVTGFAVDPCGAAETAMSKYVAAYPKRKEVTTISISEAERIEGPDGWASVRDYHRNIRWTQRRATTSG